MTKRTSDCYITTLDVNSVNDMQMLELIRKTVKVSNNRNSKKHRVVVRGRKPIENKTIYNWRDGSTRTVGYDFAGNIVNGLQNATRLDVYVYERR